MRDETALHAQYLICQQRGHEATNELAHAGDPRNTNVCRWCRTHYWTEFVQRESHIPDGATPVIADGDLRMEAYGTSDPVHGTVGVAILHVPTGMTEACDSERSRIANTVIALQRLSERLALLESGDHG